MLPDQYGYPIETVLLVGDRANLNDEMALADILNQLRWPRLRPPLPPAQERCLLPDVSPGEAPLLLPAV